MGSSSAIGRGPDAALSRRATVGSSTRTALGRTLQCLRSGRRPPAVCPGGVAHRQLPIMEIGCLIALRRCVIARARHDITSGGRLDAGPGGLPALLGAAIAKVTRGVVHGRVATVYKVAIAGRLIGVGRSLIAIRGGLVAVRPRLIGICDGLIAIGDRLIVVERP